MVINYKTDKGIYSRNFKFFHYGTPTTCMVIYYEINSNL